jgi:hypothetical protein
MSKWLFFPSPAASGPTLSITGTFDFKFGYGGGDNTPTITGISTSNFNAFGNRGDGSTAGIHIVWNAWSAPAAASRNAFLAAFPSNFAPLTYVDGRSTTQYTTNSPWAWDTSFAYSLRILTAQWSTWPGAAWPQLDGLTFSLTG